MLSSQKVINNTMFFKNDNEEIILETSPSIKSVFNLINLIIFMFIVWNIYEYFTASWRFRDGELRDSIDWAILFLIRIAYAYLKTIVFKYVITNQRVVKIDGLITRKTTEIPLTSIETVNFKEGLIERFLKLGTIVLTGKGVSKFELKNLENAIDVKNIIKT